MRKILANLETTFILLNVDIMNSHVEYLSVRGLLMACGKDPYYPLSISVQDINCP